MFFYPRLMASPNSGPPCQMNLPYSIWYVIHSGELHVKFKTIVLVWACINFGPAQAVWEAASPLTATAAGSVVSCVSGCSGDFGNHLISLQQIRRNQKSAAICLWSSPSVTAMFNTFFLRLLPNMTWFSLGYSSMLQNMNQCLQYKNKDHLRMSSFS